jgi:hypothetical protein
MAEDVIDRVVEVYMYKLDNKDGPDNNDNSNDNANKNWYSALENNNDTNKI